MNNSIIHLFVYGSLRSGFRNPAYSYLSKYFNLVGQGYVKGQLFDTGTYPVAKASTEEKYIVGELYVINNPLEFDWAIEQLDDYEGTEAEEGEPALYKREASVVSCNHQLIDAWVYWYIGDTSNMTPIASGDLMEYLDKKNRTP